MKEESIKDRLSSRKFIFSLFSFVVVSVLLYFDKLPPSYYEGVSVAIVLTYLSSNVANRFVNNRYGGSYIEPSNIDSSIGTYDYNVSIEKENHKND